MLHGFFTTLFIISALLLILFIFVQKGKGSMGLGSLGGGTQMLFGGSGGQDLFQKITWVLGAIVLVGSLFLSILNTPDTSFDKYENQTPAPTEQR